MSLTRELSRTPNNIPYEVNIIPPTIADNAIITGTGNAFPDPTIQASSINGGTFSATSHGVDLNPSSALTSGIFRNPISGVVSLTSGGTAQLITSASSAKIVAAATSLTVAAGNSGHLKVGDGSNSYGTAGQVLTADGSLNCSWQTPSIPYGLHQVISWNSFGISPGSNTSFYCNDADWWQVADAPPPQNTIKTPDNNMLFGYTTFAIGVAGQYMITLYVSGGDANGGILDVYVDNVLLTSIDDFLPPNGRNTWGIYTNLTVGTHTIEMKCVSKNVGSGGYAIYLACEGLHIDACF